MKTNPIQSQYKPNQTQNKPNQTQLAKCPNERKFCENNELRTDKDKSRILRLAAFIILVFGLEYAYGLCIIDIAGAFERCLAGAGCVRPAGELDDCHIDVYLRVVDVGRQRLFHLYVDNHRASGDYRGAVRIFRGDARSSKIGSEPAWQRCSIRRCDSEFDIRVAQREQWAYCSSDLHDRIDGFTGF